MPFTSHFPVKWIALFLFMIVASLLQGEENLFCLMDEREWKIGFEAQQGNEKIIELVLENDDINNWKELFTVQQFEGLPVSAAQFVAVLKEASQTNLPEHETLRFQLIQSDSAQIFESSFISDQAKDSSLLSSDEYNIGRVLKGESALYYLRYSTKDAKQFEQNKQAWINRLALAYTATQPRKKESGKWFAFTAKGIYDRERLLSVQSNYQFIENAEIGYSLSIPKNWKVVKLDPPTANQLDFETAYKESARFFSPHHQIEGKISFLDISPSLANFKASAHYLQAYKASHPDAKLVGKGTLKTVLGQEGHYLIVVDKEKKGWINVMRTINRIYLFELWTNRSQFHDLKKELENIVLNFQILSSLSSSNRDEKK